jgi:hypothetical protein
VVAIVTRGREQGMTAAPAGTGQQIGSTAAGVTIGGPQHGMTRPP